MLHFHTTAGQSDFVVLFLDPKNNNTPLAITKVMFSLLAITIHANVHSPENLKIAITFVAELCITVNFVN